MSQWCPKEDTGCQKLVFLYDIALKPLSCLLPPGFHTLIYLYKIWTIFRVLIISIEKTTLGKFSFRPWFLRFSSWNKFLIWHYCIKIVGLVWVRSENVWFLVNIPFCSKKIANARHFLTAPYLPSLVIKTFSYFLEQHFLIKSQQKKTLEAIIPNFR